MKWNFERDHCIKTTSLLVCRQNKIHLLFLLQMATEITFIVFLLLFLLYHSRSLVRGVKELVRVHVLKMTRGSQLLEEPFNPQATDMDYAYAIDVSPNKNPRLKVVLDLDECLVCDMTNPRRRSRSQVTMDTEYVMIPVSTESPLRVVHGVTERLVLLRPGLVDFLWTVMSLYETHIFTASLPEHADPILDYLERQVGRSFVARWYRGHCTRDCMKGLYKDLRIIPSCDLRRTVLIDNSIQNFTVLPANGIPVRDFWGDANDTTLFSVLELLKELQDTNDVRTVLSSRFAVAEGFEEFGYSGIQLRVRLVLEGQLL
jgi:Dullard-like phosphatase family protein